MKPLVAITLLALAVACSNGDKAPPSSTSGSGSGTDTASNIPLPKDDMVEIAAGHYLLSELAFAPEADGSCPTATLAKVEALSKAPWPSLSQHIERFTIDKRAVTCDDYRKCVRAKSCRRSDDRNGPSCGDGTALVSLEQAVAYCRWRGAKLPTLTQWQAAFRGRDGRTFGECDPSVDAETCLFTTKSGLVVELQSPFDEFTSTLGCWSNVGLAKKSGRFPVTASTFVRQLDLFGPYDPDAKFPSGRANVHTARFRCVRDQALVIPGTKP